MTTHHTPAPPLPTLTTDALCHAAHVLGSIAREIETQAPGTRAWTLARTAFAAGFDGEPLS